MKKLKIQEKDIFTHSSGPQGNLKQLFFVLTQSQKSLLVLTAHMLVKMICTIWRTFEQKKFFISALKSPTYSIQTLCHKNH
jgi:hypothetical protein